MVTPLQRKGYLNDLTCREDMSSLSQAEVMLHLVLW
jgi:hypothetical protein